MGKKSFLASVLLLSGLVKVKKMTAEASTIKIFTIVFYCIVMFFVASHFHPTLIFA